MTQPPRRYEVAYKKDASGNVGKYMHIDEIGGIAEDKRRGVLFCAVCSCAMHYEKPRIDRREHFAHDVTTDESRCERDWHNAIASREPQSLSDDARERLFDISQYVQLEYCSVNVRRQDHSLCVISAVNPSSGTFVEFAMVGDGCLVAPYNRLCDANIPAAVMLTSGAWKHTHFQRMVWIYKVPSILLGIRRVLLRDGTHFLHASANWASNLVEASRDRKNEVLIELNCEHDFFLKLETPKMVNGFLRNRVSILKKSSIKDVIGEIARPVINAGHRPFDALQLSGEDIVEDEPMKPGMSPPPPASTPARKPHISQTYTGFNKETEREKRNRLGLFLTKNDADLVPINQLEEEQIRIEKKKPRTGEFICIGEAREMIYVGPWKSDE